MSVFPSRANTSCAPSRPPTHTHTLGQKERDNNNKHPLNMRGHRETARAPPPDTSNPAVHWSVLIATVQRDENNHWLLCLVEFLSQNTPPICVLGIVENKQWSNLCLHSGRRHSVCEIYANKRYCFCSETHLAWFPCVYCKRRHLQANHSRMDVGGGGATAAWHL